MKYTTLILISMLVLMSSQQNNCDQTQTYDSQQKRCLCNASGQDVDNKGKCSPCPQFSTFEFYSKTCICNYGYKWDANKQNWNCVPRCGANQDLDTNGLCSCSPWYVPTANGCQLCPKQSYYNFHQCFCPVGSAWESQSNTCKLTCNGQFQKIIGEKCQCQDGYYRLNNICTICPKNSIWNPIFRQCGCRSTQQLDTQKTSCVKKCLENQVRLTDGSCVCQDGFKKAKDGCVTVCLANQHWLKDACVCDDTYNRINGVCSQCPAHQHWLNDACVCDDTYNRVNGVCTQCPAHQHWLKDVCVCDDTYNRMNGVCSQCPANQEYDAQSEKCNCLAAYQRDSSGICIPICLNGQKYVDGKCSCIVKGQFLINNACRACPQFSSYVPYYQDCICYGGFKKQNQFCVPMCPQGQNFFNGICECPNNKVRINQLCVNCADGSHANGKVCQCDAPNKIWNSLTNTCDLFCGDLQVKVGDSCVCKQGLHLIKGLCKSCPDIAPYKSDTQQCVCSQGKSFNYDSWTCQKSCQVNQKLVDNQCVCVDGFNLIDSKCQACPAFQIFNKKENKCVCQEGTKIDDKNNCVSICGENEVYSNGVCVCSVSTNRIGQKCAVCPTNTIYVAESKSCICIQGTKLDDNKNCVSICQKNEIYSNKVCTCVNGMFKINGICQQCMESSQFNEITSKCECKYGFAQKDGKCISLCRVNQAYVNNVCQCSSGFDLIEGLCGNCPPHSKYNSAIQACFCQDGFQLDPSKIVCNPICPQGQQAVNGACQCKGGLHFINGACAACPQFSTYIAVEQRCQCNAHYKQLNSQCIPECNELEVWQDNQCICQNPYKIINGKCSKCPENGYFWATSCICNYGFTYQADANVCKRACPDDETFVNGECKCQSGLIRHNGDKCVTCPTGSFFNAPMNVCQCNFGSTWNNNKTDCV